jgi:hypothetical protein
MSILIRHTIKIDISRSISRFGFAATAMPMGPWLATQVAGGQSQHRRGVPADI